MNGKSDNKNALRVALAVVALVIFVLFVGAVVYGTIYSETAKSCRAAGWDGAYVSIETKGEFGTLNQFCTRQVGENFQTCSLDYMLQTGSCDFLE